MKCVHQAVSLACEFAVCEAFYVPSGLSQAASGTTGGAPDQASSAAHQAPQNAKQRQQRHFLETPQGFRLLFACLLLKRLHSEYAAWLIQQQQQNTGAAQHAQHGAYVRGTSPGLLGLKPPAATSTHPAKGAAATPGPPTSQPRQSEGAAAGPSCLQDAVFRWMDTRQDAFVGQEDADAFGKLQCRR